MARRAAGALTALLTLAALALPAALLASSPPAAAATSAVPAAVAFTGLNPLWASPGKKITVTGTVKNNKQVPQQLVVELLSSPTPITTVSGLQQSAAAGNADNQVSVVVSSAPWTSRMLAPGAVATWSFSVPVNAMGATSFGVYKIAAQVQNTQGTNLVNALTYVPYVPAKKGPFGSSTPATQKVSLVWPLMDQPLLDGPWQNACKGPQAAALAGSLASGGRLSQLVDAGGSTASTAVVQAQSNTGRAGRQQAPLTDSQDLASATGLTWAVDPALLANAAKLALCGSRAPQWAQAASAWLTRLKAVTARQPLFVTPYADPDVSTLTSQAVGLGSDVDNAFTYGAEKARQILGEQALTSGLAWAPDGPTSYFTLENLASRDRVSTLLLSGSALPSERASVVRTGNGAGGFIGHGYINVLLANDSLAALLGSASSAPGSAFGTAQEFLAETALLVKQNPSAAIVVAPPRRWQPAPGLAADVLTAVASAPWLSPATMDSLTAARHIPTFNTNELHGSAPAFGQYEASRLKALDAEVAQLESITAGPVPALHLAVSTAESSAYTGQRQSAALAVIKMLQDWIPGQETQVHIIAESRITLGGTRGSVPVSILNQLAYPVRVKLQLSYTKTGGTRITPSPAGPVTVGPHSARTVKLRIAATHVGSTTVTLSLANSAGQPLTSRPSVRTTVQTTQVGLLGVIIFGVALGVFLIASGVRALRRGKPGTAPGEPTESTPSDDQGSGHSTEEAAPDTVVAEHGELGTAGPPRPR